MTRFRFAHASDIHFTLPPLAHARELSGKHWSGVASYFLGRRRWRFHDVGRRISVLLEDVDALGVNHAFFTGDLTAISLPDEFAGCAALFGPRLAQPDRFTLIPGNHDRYHPEAAAGRYFERHFDAVGPAGAGFPFLKRPQPGLSIVGLDVSRPTSFTHSSGFCGAEQIAATAAHLRTAAAAGDLVVVLLHYGLLHASGRRDRYSHRLRDDLALTAVLDDPAVRVDLVLHGHMHDAFDVRTARRLVLCAGSATDLHEACGYNVYEVDTGARTLQLQRRVWDRERGAYVDKGPPAARRLDG